MCLYAVIVGSASLDAIDDFQKKSELYFSNLRKDLSKATLERHESQLPIAYKHAVNSFNNTCDIIKKHCLLN